MDSKWIFIIGIPLVVYSYMTEDSYSVKEAKAKAEVSRNYTQIEWNPKRDFELFHPCRKNTYFNFKAYQADKPVSGIICIPRYAKPYVVLD